MMDLKTLRELVKLMVSNDLTELDLQDKDEKVALKRGPAGGEQAVHLVAPTAMPAAAAPAAATPAPTAAPAKAEANSDEGLVAIPSPMVGTYYSSPNPDAAVFVSVGDHVGDDTVVCIIEAMKVFNEIKAETSGTIAKVLVENGDAVEFGQPLFMIKPK